MQTLLLICADALLSSNIIRNMENEFNIWHVARQRDAMAWLNQHQPQSVVMDLDLLGQSARSVLDKVRKNNKEQISVIGVCQSPEPLSPDLLNQLDQLIINHAI
jgi:DNA-binding response OmpR family regulator